MDTSFVMFVVAAFLAVVLALEGLYNLWASRASGEAKRLASRLQALSGDIQAGATSIERSREPSRLPRLNEIFARIEEWTMTKTKFEAMDILNKHDIPCGPILSMKELAQDQSLRATGTVVEVEHPTRGKYLSVGNPINLSDSITEVKRSPLLGEHTDEILSNVLKLSAKDIAEIKASGALSAPEKKDKAA